MLGYWKLRYWPEPDASGAPAAPTITAVDGGDEDSIVVTIDGDAGATNTIYYRISPSLTWISGGSRSDDGDITVTGLEPGQTYEIIATSTLVGYTSAPSNPVEVRVVPTSESTTNPVFGDRNEDRAKRQTFTNSIGLVIQTQYHLPTNLSASMPSRGSLMPGEANTLLSIRLVDWRRGALISTGGLHTYDVTWIQPQAYGTVSTNSYQEVRGSRRIVTKPGYKVAIELGVASDLANLPQKGDLFTGETDQLTGMRCVDVEYDQTTVPGLYFVTSRYFAFRTL